MSNGTEHIDDDAGIEQLLNRLIRAAAEQTPDDFIWPPHETILAYLHGNADAGQQETIQTALAQSAAFRHFLIDTAEQLDAVTSEATASAFDAVQVPASLSRTDRKSVRRQPRWFELLLRPRVLAPAIVGAVVIVLLLKTDPLGLFNSRSSMFAAYAELDRSEFVPLSQRGTSSGDEAAKAFTTAYDAAMDRLRKSVAYDLTTGEYKLTDGTPPALSTTVRDHVLRLLDDAGSTIGEITIPSYTNGEAPIEAWILAPPALTLWHSPLSDESTAIKWPSVSPACGCVTVTLHTDSGYVATPGQVIQF